MLKSVYCWLVFWSMQLTYNYAYAQESSGNDEGGGGALFGLLYLAAIWAYPANKWRLWKIGFKYGNASKDVFIDAMKWSGIAMLMTVIPFGLIVMCSK